MREMCQPQFSITKKHGHGVARDKSVKGIAQMYSATYGRKGRTGQCA